METYCTIIKDFSVKNSLPWQLPHRENFWTVKIPWPWKNNPSWKFLQFELMTNCEEFQPWKLLYREKYQSWKFMTVKSYLPWKKITREKSQPWKFHDRENSFTVKIMNRETKTVTTSSPWKLLQCVIFLTVKKSYRGIFLIDFWTNILYSK